MHFSSSGCISRVVLAFWWHFLTPLALRDPPSWPTLQPGWAPAGQEQKLSSQVRHKKLGPPQGWQSFGGRGNMSGGPTKEAAGCSEENGFLVSAWAQKRVLKGTRSSAWAPVSSGDKMLLCVNQLWTKERPTIVFLFLIWVSISTLWRYNWHKSLRYLKST